MDLHWRKKQNKFYRWIGLLEQEWEKKVGRGKRNTVESGNARREIRI